MPAAKPAIVLIDHGSRRREANQQLEAVAALLRQREPDRIVRIAHMEIAEPSLSEAIATCVADGATDIVVHPYLLGPGRHSQEDIPAQCAAAASLHPGVSVRVSPPLGVHEKLVDVILERVAEA